MIHKQGAEYKDSTEIEEAVQEDAASKKKTWKMRLAVGALVGVVLLVLLGIIVAKVVGNDNQDPAPSDSSSPGIVVGDDAYWDQFEDPSDMFSYTDEEKQQLRAWGYTGDEIEEHESNETLSKIWWLPPVRSRRKRGPHSLTQSLRSIKHC